MYLLIKPTGLKTWMWKYGVAGKARELQLGKYPDVGLAEARALRDQAHQKLRLGTDPLDERRRAKLAAKIAQGNSFEAVARNWWQGWSQERHPRYAQDVMSRFEANVFPLIGHRPVSQITAPDLVMMMEHIHSRGAADIAQRARNSCGQVFRYAIAKGLATHNPAAEFRPGDILPPKKVINHARVDEAELPLLMRRIEAYEGATSTRLAIKLLALTFVRTSELIGARWAEIDWEKAEWRIPAERMKMRRIHIVPLASQAIELLKTLQVVTGRYELLFPGERDSRKPMSNNTILKALERMGYKGRMTGHGFRGVACTHLYEKQFASDHIEIQLAHSRSKIRGAYDYSRQLPERRQMMQYWANYLDASLLCSAPQGGND